MYELKLSEGYHSPLSLRETERAIKLCKDTFERRLAKILSLERVSAPILVRAGSGINDDLNGVERFVRFDLKEMDCEAEVVQSLAKWKRMALYRYQFGVGEGLYTDMNAIRRDDNVDNLHSIFVDQWDWERVIAREDRNTAYLRDVVRGIVKALVATQKIVQADFPVLQQRINPEVTFITAEALEQQFPTLTPEQREVEITRLHGTVFIEQIGGLLPSGIRHGGRAPDYDDWTLNGDLFVWCETLGTALEVSSMGVRVDAEALQRQLAASGHEDRMQYAYHQAVADNTLPLTVGGGIGQSRLCMLLLEKLHIGEVQTSVWPEEMVERCLANGIQIL